MRHDIGGQDLRRGPIELRAQISQAGLELGERPSCRREHDIHADAVPADQHREQSSSVHGGVDVVDRVRVVFGEPFRGAIGQQRLIQAQAQRIVEAREHR